jgi:putative ABC transport system permease protein
VRLLASIALRNLLRNRRRSALSLLVVASGVAGLLLTAGFIRFSFAGLQDALIRGGLGHLAVTRLRDDQRPTSPGNASPPELAGWQELRAEIEALPEVAAAEGVVQLTGVVSRADRSTAFVGVAGEPERERRMRFDQKLRAGAELPGVAPAEGEDRVLLGLELARSLGAAPGDVVTLMAMTTSGTLNAVDMVVAGLFTTGLVELDGRLLKLHLASAQRLIESQAVSTIVVGLRADELTEPTRLRLSGTLASRKLTVVDWRTRAPFFGQVRSLYLGVFYFLGGVIFMLVCLSTSNTLMMAILERMRELGTLLAIGTSRAQLSALVLLEALWLGLLGGAMGGVLGFCVAAGLNAVGIEMPPPPGAVDPVLLELWLRPPDFVAAVALMAVLLGVSALVPILRLLRIPVVDALGHV